MYLLIPLCVILSLTILRVDISRMRKLAIISIINIIASALVVTFYMIPHKVTKKAPKCKPRKNKDLAEELNEIEFDQIHKRI